MSDQLTEAVRQKIDEIFDLESWGHHWDTNDIISLVEQDVARRLLSDEIVDVLDGRSMYSMHTRIWAALGAIGIDVEPQP